MLNFIASVVLIGLLIPSGFNFLTQKVIDYSSPGSAGLAGPVRIVNNSFGLKTTARSILIIDDQSGAILYNRNSSAILPIASITKLVTALVILDIDPDWEREVEITGADHREGGITYLLTGEKITVRDLFYLMLVGSTNEAAVALARTSGIDDFPAAMNRQAAELGMESSYFIEPSGISAENVSTPADLIKLAQAAFSRPEIKAAAALLEYEFTVLNTKRPGKATNTDKLLDSFLNGGDYRIIGAKTGYLDEAGYCLLLQVKKTEGPTLTLALFGMESTTDRWQEAKGLVDWVFRNYVWP